MKTLHTYVRTNYVRLLSALYHYSDAEPSQTKQAIKRHGKALKSLATLPWVDLLDVFHEVPIGIPGAWKFGLKEVSTAVSAYSPEHAVTWPEGLNSGQGAQVALWEAYALAKPLETEQMALVSLYLESDVKALWCLLRWLEDSTKEERARKVKACHGEWFSMAAGRTVQAGTLLEPVLSVSWYTASLRLHSPDRR